MINIYSPNNIEVLLHCHVCPYPHPRIDAPAVQDAIMMLQKEGAIELDTCSITTARTYKTTPKGKAWVRALCSVPPPKMVWVDEQGRIL